jgi:hypothetical protein
MALSALQAEEGAYDVAFTVPAGDEPIPTEVVDASTPTTTLAPVELEPGLATTGVDVNGPLALALLALLAGHALLVARRARRVR